MDGARFKALLASLVRHSERLQNAPDGQKRLIPREDLVVREVVNHLTDVETVLQAADRDALIAGCSFGDGDSGENVDDFVKQDVTVTRGALRVRRVCYVPGRSNLILEVNRAFEKSAESSGQVALSFVGSHMDVVSADAATWTVDPFQLTERTAESGSDEEEAEADTLLFGRGTTDCLGHVALLTLLFAQLASQSDAKLLQKGGVVAMLIADEEDGSGNCGVERLAEDGLLKPLAGAPLVWLDASDASPWIGTGGAQTWRLTAKGKLTHSGFPHTAVNALELAMDGITAVQRRFYADFPPHPSEKEWAFPDSGSSLKPTSWSCPAGSLNAIRGEAVVEGDIRLTPFYPMASVKAAVERCVEELNANIEGLVLPGNARGPSHYDLSESNDGPVGELVWEWLGPPMIGVACDTSSPGFKALQEALRVCGGDPKPFACTGSLPLVAGLKEQGLDVQITGFGVGAVYHGNDEYCRLSGMKVGFNTLLHMVTTLTAQ